MSFIKKLNANQYLHIFEAYEKGYSFQYIINALNIDINPQTLSYKYRDYKAHGIDVLLPNTKRNCYSKKLKLNIINEYLHSDLSSYDLAIKYGIFLPPYSYKIIKSINNVNNNIKNQT